MPEITMFGWFHTATGILALLTGSYTLARYKVIRIRQAAGRSYLMLTLIAAASALGIYKHGGFGIAHALAVLTIIAVLVGGVAETTRLFGRMSRHMQAGLYSATILFHMIPAITDGLLRLPTASPIATSPEDPLLRGFYLAFLAAYVLGFGLQIRWLRGHFSSED